MDIRHLLFLLFFFIISVGVSGQVKIGDNPTTIDPNSVLEIESINKGLLMPRISLLSTSNPSPLTVHIAGMTVYNTANINDITPGFYYNDGSKWVKLAQNFTVNNGVNISGGNNITLGGDLNQPTVLGTDTVNTLAITGLNSANPAYDEIVMIDPVTGVFKKAPSSSLVKVKQSLQVSVNGQTQFTTPLSISDMDNINLYRNGVRIGATFININTIALEPGIISVTGDEIRIVQFY